MGYHIWHGLRENKRVCACVCVCVCVGGRLGYPEIRVKH